MSAFSGPYPGEKTNRGPNRKRGPKGVQKMHRQDLRRQAEKRQADYDAKHKATPPAPKQVPETVAEIVDKAGQDTDAPKRRVVRRTRTRKVKTDE